jgi:hypothetical protein
VQSHVEEVCVETLRARYAELLRLREYVERLEELCGTKANSDPTADEIQGRDASRVAGLFG